jgi:tRNA 2-selenouridine synthase
VIIDKLELLKKRFKNDVLHKTMMEHAFNKEYTEVIRILLEHYYDPRYNFKKNDYKNEFVIIQADDLEMAIKEIEWNICQFYKKVQIQS